jgi:cbb3-type cytochrome oxidase maturation protein
VEVLILLLFIGIVLAGCGVAFFTWNVKQHNHEHAARLSLLPLENDSEENGPQR